MAYEKKYVDLRRSRVTTDTDMDYVQDGELVLGADARTILVQSESDLALLPELVPGSMAYTAGFKRMWQLDVTGQWVEV